MILLNILIAVGYDLSVKIATTRLPEMHGIAINGMVIGVTTLPALLHQQTRIEFYKKWSLFRWAYFNELFAFAGFAFMYYAMRHLPVTVVSSLGVTQALFVVALERMAHLRYRKMTRDTALLPKATGILLIVCGVVLLYLS